MAKDQIIDLSTTAALNTDLGGIGVQGTNLPSNFDNALRYVGKILADAVPRHVVKAAGSYTPAKTDHNQFWRCTGAVTLNLTAAATLTDGWALWVRANGGAVTIDPNGAELIDGQATLVLADSQEALILCTGTAFFTVMSNGYIVSTDPGAAGATLDIVHISASPAVSDVPATIRSRGMDSAANLTTYGQIDFTITDPVDASEDSNFAIKTQVGAGLTTIIASSGRSMVFNGPIDVSAANSNQIVFNNTNNSANTATFDGYTDYITYTPTFTGFGTVTGISVWSKRVGDTLQLYGKFTSGTVTAVEARMTLGFNGTNANVNSDATKVPSIMLAGVGAFGAVAAAGATVLIESNIGYVTFGGQAAGSAGLTKMTGTAFIPNTTTFSFNASIPISGW